MRSLIWFRSDLRLADNPALSEAVTQSDRGCVGIFLFTSGQWKEHDWGPAKVDFLLRSLSRLSTSLERVGIPLLVREVDTFAGAAAELDYLATSHDCDALFFNRPCLCRRGRQRWSLTKNTLGGVVAAIA